MGILDSLTGQLAKDPQMARAMQELQVLFIRLHHIEAHVCQDPECPGRPKQ